MPLSKMKIGFVGLGLMGVPMARNLLTSGAILLVNNRTAKKCAPLVALGAKASPSPREMAKQVGAGIIVLCVSDTPALCTALSGPEGILSGIAPGTLVIDMGTTEVSVTKQMAYRVEQSGGRYLDAPVSGGEVGARDATLSIMVGGAPKDVERGRAIFNVLGKLVTHIGPLGTGQATKAANQVIVGASITIIAEALILAQAAGADIAHVREALLGGGAGSRILDLHGQRMVDRAFEPGALATTQLKDMRQAVALAEEINLSLPFMRLSCDLWADMIETGYGALDQSGYFDYILSKQNLQSEDTGATP